MCHSAERHAGRSLQHLTTAYGGASPQGEAFEKLHLNLMCRNMDMSNFGELNKAFPSRGSLQKSTHLWVASNKCVAGRSIKKRLCSAASSG